ncbi:MAG: hypothetical protein GXO80_02830 [Chlorobi bacterium]|nr:hypothetical protein [Chlorobiota bacterium]
MNKQQIKISDFSPHLFWDVNKKELDFEKHKTYIVNRVMQYGLYRDWKNIKQIYGLSQITEIAKNIRDLDKKSLAFLSLLSGESQNTFRCYTQTQSMQKHWNF